MIGILVDKIVNPEETKYFNKFSNHIFTTNKDLFFLDPVILKEKNILTKTLMQHKIDGILFVKKHEKIKLLNLEDFENKNDLVCITDKNWITKQPRFFSIKTNNSSELCQSIILADEETEFKNPVISIEFEFLRKYYEKKEYRKFIIEAEKWIFHNMEKTNKQVMLRYYCALLYYFKFKDLKKAFEHIGLAILIEPSLPELWCAWGDILLDQKMYEKSLEIYKNANTVRSHRNIFDLFPMWISRNDNYAEKIIQKLEKTIPNIRVLRSI